MQTDAVCSLSYPPVSQGFTVIGSLELFRPGKEDRERRILAGEKKGSGCIIESFLGGKICA